MLPLKQRNNRLYLVGSGRLFLFIILKDKNDESQEIYDHDTEREKQFPCREETLAETQNEAIQELYDNKGSFDERSIVLANTSKPQAKELAKALNATLRMTKDGRFATLTLPEDVTVFDICENDEYRRYLKYFSLDYEARISDLVTNTESEDGELNERLPARPRYSVNDSAYAYQSYLDYLNLQQTWDTKMGAGVAIRFR